MVYDNRNSNREKSKDNKNEQLPKGYLDGGYFKEEDGKQILKEEYIVDYPKKIAKALGNKQKGYKSNSEQNCRSQIRKYYAFALRIQGSLLRTGGSFSEIKAELNRLIPFVYYARSRGTVSELFKLFIEKNLEQINGTAELNAFIKHFEAIVAYLPKE